MNITHMRPGVARPKTLRRPTTDDDLSRLADLYLIKPEMTAEEVAALKEGKPYQWMRKVFIDAYRLGEKGAKPNPKVVTLVEAQPEIIVP